ncbi:MAG: tRNA uracil 4-sulfurtransferase ThiI [Clostridia bacterium]
MQKVILIRYGEIFLKGRNRGFFENCLINNIKTALKGFKYELIVSQCRYFIENFSEEDFFAILEKLKKVFGIYSISPATKVKTDIDVIKNVALEYSKAGTFKVKVNRADKSIPKTSTEIASDIGGFILDNCVGTTVDLFNPSFVVNVDIREKGHSYIFSEVILGQQGMPIGSAGKGLLLLSGGIDSPVAGYKMAKKGMTISAIHYHSYPFTSEQAKQKVFDLGKIISDYTTPFDLYVVPFTEIQQAIHKCCKEDYMITIMRRIMVRIAEKVAIKNGCGALITGESLGQVASQTLESITSTNSVMQTMPVFRPLIAMDKSEIIEVARKIDTYETSILPYEDCCTVFLPKNPLIKPKIDKVILEENHLDLETLMQNALDNIEVVHICNN